MNSRVSSTYGTSLGPFCPPVVLAIAACCTVAGCTYFYVSVSSSASSTSSRSTNETRLHRSNAVRRTRHLRPISRQVTAQDQECPIDQVAIRSSFHYGDYTATDPEGRKVILPLVNHDLISAPDIARQFSIGYTEALQIRQHLEVAFLEAFFARAMPLGPIRQLSKRVRQDLVQDLGLCNGLSPENVEDALDRYCDGTLESHKNRVERADLARDEDQRYEQLVNGSAGQSLTSSAIGQNSAISESVAYHHDQSVPADRAETVVEHSEHSSLGKVKDQTFGAMMLHIAEEQARKEGYVHRGFTCDECNTFPIRGIRYSCSNCAGYDLCELCESQQVHDRTHLLYKIRIPVRFLGTSRQLQPVWYPGKPNYDKSSLANDYKLQLCRTRGLEMSQVDALWEQFKCLAATEYKGDPAKYELAIDRATFGTYFPSANSPFRAILRVTRYVLRVISLEEHVLQSNAYPRVEILTPKSSTDKCFIPKSHTRPPPPNLVYDSIWSFYDFDCNGLIGFEEFLYGIQLISFKRPEQRLKQIFNGYDLDKDGLISRDDCQSMFKALFTLHKELAKDIVPHELDETHDEGPLRRIVSGNQALSSAFSGETPSGDPSRIGEGKERNEWGDYVVTHNGSPLTGPINTFVRIFGLLFAPFVLFFELQDMSRGPCARETRFIAQRFPVFGDTDSEIIKSSSDRLDDPEDGQEVLYAIIKDGVNELLDPLFQFRDDVGREASRSMTERSHFPEQLAQLAEARFWFDLKVQIDQFEQRCGESAKEAQTDELLNHVKKSSAFTKFVNAQERAGRAEKEISDQWGPLVEAGLVNELPRPPRTLAESQSLTRKLLEGQLRLQELVHEISAVQENEEAAIKSPSVDQVPASEELQNMPDSAHDNGSATEGMDPTSGSSEAPGVSAPLDTNQSEQSPQNQGASASSSASAHAPTTSVIQVPHLYEYPATEQPIDPTLPQNRPNQALPDDEGSGPQANGFPSTFNWIVDPNQSAKPDPRPPTPPTFDRLKYLSLMEFLEMRYKCWGGKGRINCAEFEEMMMGPKGTSLQFMGSWLDLASF